MVEHGISRYLEWKENKMKSNLKSYRLKCMVCKNKNLAGEVIMQSYHNVYMWCHHCQAHTEHKKVD